MRAYNSPSLEASKTAAGRHLLTLVQKKGNPPASLPKNLPAHLKSHPALQGERGAKLVLHGHGAGQITQIIFGLGEIRLFTPQEAAEWGENAGHTVLDERIEEVHVAFPDDLSDLSAALGFLKGMALTNVRIDEFKSANNGKGSKNSNPELSRITFSGRVSERIDKRALNDLAAIVSGIAFTRELAELPPASADPEAIVRRFEAIADKRQLQIEVWDEKRIQKEKMGLLMAVSQASSVPPRFMIVRYGKDLSAKKKKLFLVGKGVTFDTGGINLKTSPWKELLWMKKDMTGAAAVLGAMHAISQIKPDMHVIGVAPLTTNSIGSKAVIPGDVVRSYSGKTVEIQNTDAEGRLILADALHYACEQKADYIVDVATLTGACAVALGLHHSGLFSNSPGFRDTCLELSESCGEPAWPMPTSARYGEELKSKLADLSNMGKSREGGASLAAKFMERFVENTPWCHFDIAGSADLGEPAAGCSPLASAGRMVHTLVAIAIKLASSK